MIHLVLCAINRHQIYSLIPMNLDARRKIVRLMLPQPQQFAQRRHGMDRRTGMLWIRRPASVPFKAFAAAEGRRSAQVIARISGLPCPSTASRLWKAQLKLIPSGARSSPYLNTSPQCRQYRLHQLVRVQFMPPFAIRKYRVTRTCASQHGSVAANATALVLVVPISTPITYFISFRSVLLAWPPPRQPARGYCAC